MRKAISLSLSLTLAALLAAASCSSASRLGVSTTEEPSTPPSGADEKTESGGEDEAPKVVLSLIRADGSLWKEGDRVGLYSIGSGLSTLTVSDGAGTATARFEGVTAAEGVYTAFTPVSSAALRFSVDFTTAAGRSLRWGKGTGEEIMLSGVAQEEKLTLTLPAEDAISTLSLLPMKGEIATTGTFDVTTGHFSPSNGAPRRDITLGGEASQRVDVDLAFGPLGGDPYAALLVGASGLYSVRLQGGETAARAVQFTVGSDCGFSVNALTQTTLPVDAGQYSGITYLEDSRYAVVHDKADGGGIYFFEIPLDGNGNVGTVTASPAPGNATAGVSSLDNEGVAYYAPRRTLFVSSESDQQVREYDLTGKATGRYLDIPADMGKGYIASNMGFESLTYNARTNRFWTTTEGELRKDADGLAPFRLLRLQSFDGSTLKAADRYLYLMDPAETTAEKVASASSYVHGVPALAALDDGRLLVLEREVYVPGGSKLEMALYAFTRSKIYLVDPAGDASGLLHKDLVSSFSTSALTLANYEGMCLGPKLSDGTTPVLLIADSQDGKGGLVAEYVKVVKLSL